MFLEYEEQCNFFQGIHPEKKYRVVLTEKKISGFLHSKNLANFEAFLVTDFTKHNPLIFKECTLIKIF